MSIDNIGLTRSELGSHIRVRETRHGDYLHLFASGACSACGAEQSLRNLVDQVTKSSTACVVLARLAVYVRNQSQVEVLKPIIKRMKDMGGVVDVAIQPPLKGQIAFWAWFVSDNAIANADQDRNLVHILYPTCGTELVICGNTDPSGQAPSDFEAAINYSFVEMSERLKSLRFSMRDCIRLWMLIPRINEKCVAETNYQISNRSRIRWFEGMRFPITPSGDLKKAYPASTGIGSNMKAFAISAIACHPGTQALLAALENPAQVPAFHYPEHESRYSPLFSRGIALVIGGDALVFISGTASIRGAVTCYPHDVKRQVIATLENLDILLSTENLSRCNPPLFGNGLASLRQCTVYVRRAESAEIVSELVTAALPPNTPLTIVEAEICRPDLLVEIEGIAACYSMA